MLDYEWGNPASIMLSGDDPIQDSNQAHQILDHFTQSVDDETLVNPHGFNTSTHAQTQAQFHSFYNPLLASRLSYPLPPPAAMHSLEPLGSSNSNPTGFMVVPKSEPFRVDFATSLGLNLGVRTYFSSEEDDLVNGLNRESKAVEPRTLNLPRCQAQGCNADLTHAKHYHRRHKVCEFHSKAATVIAAGLIQRFCQQCSRFHLLSEFDNGKRSCRRRLADHNRRRRKSQPNQEHKSQIENACNYSSSDKLARSPADSGAGAQSSSVTAAMSPPRRISLHCFQKKSYQAASSTT